MWVRDVRGHCYRDSVPHHEKPPVLVEVRFPNMGTASDWFLCEDAVALDAILDRLGPGVEVHLDSVWDLKNPSCGVVYLTIARRE